MRLRVFLISVCVLLASSAFAQVASPPPTLVVTDTGKIQFDVSPDNDVQFGTPPLPLVASYRIDLYAKADATWTGADASTAIAAIRVGATPLVTRSLPKTTGVASLFLLNLKTALAPNVEYVAAVTAIGPTPPTGPTLESGASVARDPFGYPGPPRRAGLVRVIP